MGKESVSEKKASFRHPEAKGLFLLSASLILCLSLLTLKMGYPSSNWLGLLGYGIGFTLSYLLGISSFFLVAYLFWLGWKLLSSEQTQHFRLKSCFVALFILSFSFLLNLCAEMQVPLPSWIYEKIYTQSTLIHSAYPHYSLRRNLGGAPLYYLYKDLPLFNMERLLGNAGVGIVFSITSFLFFFLWSELKLSALISGMQYLIRSLKEKQKPVQSSSSQEEAASSKELERSLSTPSFPQPIYTQKKEKGPSIRTLSSEDPIQENEKPKKMVSKRDAALAAQKIYNGDFTAYTLPPPSLLTNGKKVDHPSLKKELLKQAEILEETLLSFGIEAKVGEIHCGPTITSFEVLPAIGVKVQKITALENDIALKLQAKSIRIIAPIPGKAAVGVEIPSLYPQEVSFKELLLNYQQSPRKLAIPIVLGKTVSGENVITDLTKMPHCIIAGATGSGKSVCINTMIISILMNARPDEIKLLMVDPKKVELTSYTSLPHMIAPVITEAHGAYAALSWLVKEMQNRYDILKQLGVRNIASFNTRSINKELEASLNISIPEKIPYIVAIIDEFADLMMASSSDLETPIARIAQMARAVGIHLILATQRPSREVITGLIKANFPTRISFKVASRINSQIVLDETGAESLLGNGDLLFLPPGSSQLIRAQGAYISDEEIHKVVSFISEQAPARYEISSFDTHRAEPTEGEEGDETRDSLYEKALQIVIETKNASTTFLQRKLKIGYARAASLIDELEAKGVIGPAEGSKPRHVFAKETPERARNQIDE